MGPSDVYEHAPSNVHSQKYVYVCTCVSWPHPTPLLDKKIPPVTKDCSGLLFKMFFKELHHYTALRQSPQSIKPRPTSISLFPSLTCSFSSWLWCLSVGMFETMAKMRSCLQCDRMRLCQDSETNM